MTIWLTEKPPLRRFWSKVAVQVGVVNEEYEPCGSRFCAGCRTGGHCWRRWPCWNYQGKPVWNGYGRFGFDKKSMKAHRVAFELSNFVCLLPSACVCHHCDNRLCCNSRHLFLGSIADDHEDRNEKGRTACGITSGRSKLNEWQTVGILARYLQIIPISQIAREFGCSEGATRHICKGRNWKALFSDGEPVAS